MNFSPAAMSTPAAVVTGSEIANVLPCAAAALRNPFATRTASPTAIGVGDQQTRDIPIIALSAHALAGSREKALAAGCDEFDTKPIEFDRLVATMRRVLAARK